MSKLPPWTGDDAAMQRWLDDKLDELLKEDGAKARARRRLPYSAEEKQVLFPEESDEGAIAAAEQRGDIEPARRRLPKYARLLQPPKRGRGKRYLEDKATKWKGVMNHPRDSRLALAVMDVSRIRALWQKHFQKKNRSKHEGEKSAEHFAAERWGLTEDEVSEAMRIKRLRPPE